MTKEDKPLTHFTDRGIKLIPTYEGGATKGSWKDPDNYTTDMKVITSCWKEQGIRRYQLHPADNKLICLDLDRKNGKDGLRELQTLLRDVYLPRYISALDFLIGDKQTWDPADGSFPFPCWTQTPSGGFHLYFLYEGQPVRSREIAPGLEVVHYNHLITAPGSWKDGKPYLFRGSLDRLRWIPPVLLKLLIPKEQPRRIVWEYKQQEFGDLNLNQIAEIIDRQGEYSPEVSRNRYSYELAKFACKQGCPADEVEQYIITRWGASDFSEVEIRQTVQSAYRR